MRSTILVVSLLLTGIAVHAQTAPQKPSYEAEVQPAESVSYSPQLVHDLAALRDAAMSSDYAYQQVAHLTENIGPRPIGSPQAQAAVNYVADEMRKLGLEVKLEEVRVPRWIRGPESAELVEYPGQVPETAQKIVVTALGGNTPTPPEGITGEVIAVKSFEDLKALGRARVEGKIVLFTPRFDLQKAADGFALEGYEEAVQYRGRGPKAAADLGAVATLVRSMGTATYRLPHTGWCAPAGIPAGSVTSEDADLIAHLAAQGKVRVHLVLSAHYGPEVTSYNVVADLKGSEHPEQVVIVSGHLDSWDLATGAIDDAAGVAVAMATAQLIQQQHLRPSRTIRVIAWMDEEYGGRGREAYAKAHASEFANHTAAIESDLGAGHPLGFWARIVPSALPQLQPAREILSTFGANLIKLVTDGPSADIEPLAVAGIPAFGVMQDARTYFHYHHTPADTLDKINPQELRENAAAIAVMGYALASAPASLSR